MSEEFDEERLNRGLHGPGGLWSEAECIKYMASHIKRLEAKVKKLEQWIERREDYEAEQREY